MAMRQHKLRLRTPPLAAPAHCTRHLKMPACVAHEKISTRIIGLCMKQASHRAMRVVKTPGVIASATLPAHNLHLA